jgi:diguanylate cyclase (GGDEF)-like protein
MFRWPRKQTQQDEAGVVDGSITAPGPSPWSDDEALDAFVQVLRAFGRYAFDVDGENVTTFSARCGAWARHLLNLSPVPADAQPGSAEPDVASGSDGPRTVRTRDWATAVRFFVVRRQREQQHVAKALGDLRQSIWAFAQSLGTVLMEDQQADDRLKLQIERLKVALERLSPEELREEVVAAASSLSMLVGERQHRQRERLEVLGAKVADLTSQLREAREEGARDPLTRLANRRALDEFLNRMVFMRDVFAETACLVLLDVDRFKRVNDTFGHPAGDEVLKALADCLVRNFPRKSDLVARYGGEELAVVLPATTAPDASRLGERLLSAIRALEVRHGDQAITVTASIGIAQLGRSESVQGWLERADQALYRAKAEGRDRAAEATPADER